MAIVNSGLRWRDVGGAIPRERVRKLATGRRSVRRRRRAGRVGEVRVARAADEPEVPRSRLPLTC